MNSLRRRIDRFCVLHPNFGIPNLMLYIVIGNIAFYLLSLFSSLNNTSFYSILSFSWAGLKQGQLWRLLSFSFLPTDTRPFWLLVSCYFYYWIGSTLEREWGTAKFTIYYLSGVLLTALGAVITIAIQSSSAMTVMLVGLVNSGIMQFGQTIGVIGGTGSGKSTLVQLLLSFRLPTEGQILFDGVSASQIDRGVIRKNISCVLQKTAVYSGTIRHNIEMGRPGAAEAEILEAADIAQLTPFLNSLPEHLEHPLQQSGKNLSGGQRQRIGIARLALRRYDLIIADEITASLDPDTSGQVMEKLLALPCMVVAITHDVSGAFMKQFDKVYRVEHGSVTQA